MLGENDGDRERGGSKLGDDDMSLSQGDISLGRIE